MVRVLVGSPVRQDPDILEYFFASIYRLVVDPDNVMVDYYFIDDNDDERSKLIMRELRIDKGQVTITIDEPGDDPNRSRYAKDESTHYWNDELIWRVAMFKNDMIRKAIDLGYDYLFLVDSDLVLHPATLLQLISSGKEIISEVFWTKWQPNSLELPNVWVKDQYTLFLDSQDQVLDQEEQYRRTLHFLAQLRYPGVYRVGGLGACTLIKRSALLAGVNFSKIENISFVGEDRHFCVRAAALGIPLFVDTHYPAIHLYRKSEIGRLGDTIRRLLAS